MARANQHLRQVAVFMTLLVGLLVASNKPRDSCNSEPESRNAMMRFATAYTNDAQGAAGQNTNTQDSSLRSSQLCMEQTTEAENGYIDNCNNQAGCEERGRALHELGSCREPVGELSSNAMERGWGTGHAAVNEVQDVGMLLPSRIVWALHVGCDR